MGTYMYRDYKKCLGAKVYTGRQELCEVRSNLASCDLIKAGHHLRLLRSQECHFEMMQKDVVGMYLADHTCVATFLVECKLQSTAGKLCWTEVHLSLEEPDCQILAIDSPPDGAHFAAARELGGSIGFEERATAEKALYVGHQTSGKMTVVEKGSTKAYMRLLPNGDAASSSSSSHKRELSCLSALFLVCLPASLRLTFHVKCQSQSKLPSLPAGRLQSGGKAITTLSALTARKCNFQRAQKRKKKLEAHAKRLGWRTLWHCMHVMHSMDVRSLLLLSKKTFDVHM